MSGKHFPRQHYLTLDIMVSNPLCSACRAIIHGAQPPEIVVQGEDALYPPERERQPHHETLESLLQAAEEGCAICTRMCRRIGPATATTSRSRKLTRSLAIQRKQGRDWCPTWVLMRPAPASADDSEAVSRLRLVIVANMTYFTDPTWSSLSFLLIPLQDLEHPLITPQHHREIGCSTTSDAAWSHAKKWYADCTASHAACKPPDSSFLPTRLLQVNHVPSPDIVKLIICADLPRPSPSDSSNNEHRYATLSHCWGGANVPKLTIHTIDALLRGVAIASLPRTFAEAIMATRTTGIPYLWIDSLCIVQDSPEDWAAEAGIMGAVYSNSTLNIMATASRDSHGGLSRERDPRLLRPIIVNTAAVIRGSEWQHLAEEDLWRTSVAEEPLNTRGWVLQERVLTPRALHFGEAQLLWECRCLNACETYPDGLPRDLLDNVDRVKPFHQSQLGGNAETEAQGSLVLHESRQGADALPAEQLAKIRLLQESILAQLQRARDDARLHELDSIWANWIQAYSAANLTHRSDKMIALSGLAKEMRSLRRGVIGASGGRDRYLAGLWRPGLLDQLLWHAIHPEETPRRPRAMAARAVNVPSSSSVARVETGIPTWSWASVDTEVIPGFAVDDSRFRVVRHVEVSNATTFPVVDGDETGSLKGGELHLKCSVALTGIVNMSTVHVDGIGRLYGVDLRLDERLRAPAEVVLVPVSTTCTTGTELVHAETSFLLLHSAADKTQGYYRRLGMMAHEQEFTAGQQEVPSLWKQQVSKTSLFLQNTSDMLIIV